MRVEVWMSRVNEGDIGMELGLTPQPDTAFSEGSKEGEYYIYIDETEQLQTIDGFGASITDAAAWLLYTHLAQELDMKEAYREVMSRLFGKEDGISLSLLRQPMGASDYARAWYTYDDRAPGETDAELCHFNVAYDEPYIIPCVRDALRVSDGRLRVMASPWSPPDWMKNKDRMLSNSYLQSYADYFIRFIEAYRDQGIPIWAVTPQNEPGFATDKYPSMRMDSASQAAFIGSYLGPALATHGLPTLVFCYDHNWNSPGQKYIEAIYRDTAAYRYAAGCAWHWYGEDYTVAYDIAHRYPDKGMWLTEGSSGDWAPCFQWRSGFANQMEAQIHYLRAGCKSIIFWNIALDEYRGPNLIDNTCRGLISIESTSGAITYNTDYFAMGHFSKFIDTGAVQVYCSEYSKEIDAVSFMNPDGSHVLVTYNVGPEVRRVSVQWGDHSFTYLIPGRTATTFRWRGIQHGMTVKDAMRRLEANCYNGRYGSIRPELCNDDTIHNGSPNGECLGRIEKGDFAIYRSMHFHGRVNRFIARVASESDGDIDVRLGSQTGSTIGVLHIPATNSLDAWQTVSCTISGVQGVHDLYLVFDISRCRIHWFRFESEDRNNLLESQNRNE